MENNSINDFAGILKEFKNRSYPGPQIGVVISAPPDLQIRLGEKIILTMKHLIIAAHVLSGYARTVDIPDSSAGGSTSVVSDHSHNIDSLTISEGSMTFKSTLVLGDEVILLPAADEQIYFLLDKAVRSIAT